jgi:hypothetical protein
MEPPWEMSYWFFGLRKKYGSWLETDGDEIPPLGPALHSECGHFERDRREWKTC